MTLTVSAHVTHRLPEREARLDWVRQLPDVYKALVRLDTVAKNGLDPRLVDLVKIRASQLNHCAFCLDMHTKDAVAAGETVERIVQLGAWAESRHFYSAHEVAALELTEAVTLLTDDFVSDAVYARAAEQFDEVELAQLIAVIVTINAFNRFGVSTCMVPGHYTPAAAPTA